MKFWNSRRNFFATVKSGKTTTETSIRYEWRWKKNSSLSNIKFNPINSILLNHRMNKQNPIKYINFPPPPFSRHKGKKISIINNRYVTRNKFNPVIFPSQVSNKISHRLLYIYFHTWFKFRSCHEKSHFSSLPLFLHPPPPPRRNHRFQYPSLHSLYTRRWSIYRTKRREPPPCLILTEEKERESKRESESEKERKRAIVYFFGLRGVASIFRWRRAKTSGTDKRGLQIVPLLPKMETPLNILCRRWRDIDWFFAPFPRSFN